MMSFSVSQSHADARVGSSERLACMACILAESGKDRSNEFRVQMCLMLRLIACSGVLPDDPDVKVPRSVFEIKLWLRIWSSGLPEYAHPRDLR
jgi:hypothetical protein